MAIVIQSEEIGEGDGYHFFARDPLVRWMRPAAEITVEWDGNCAYAHTFRCESYLPFGTAFRLIEEAVSVIPPYIPGVMIHVDLTNRTRKMYKRLGFEQTNIPGIMTASIETVNRHLERRRYCARKRVKVS